MYLRLSEYAQDSECLHRFLRWDEEHPGKAHIKPGIEGLGEAFWGVLGTMFNVVTMDWQLSLASHMLALSWTAASVLIVGPILIAQVSTILLQQCQYLHKSKHVYSCVCIAPCT
jgi:hypothetical protein